MKRKGEAQELEWIYLGTSVNLAQNIVHAQTANIDCEHPIYGLAFLKTGSLCTKVWSHNLNFSWNPCKTENTLEHDGSGWGINFKVRYNPNQLKYAYNVSTNDTAYVYDREGNIISTTTALASSLPDMITMSEGISVQAQIKWIIDEPVYLSQTNAGINDLRYIAILVKKEDARTTTPMCWKV